MNKEYSLENFSAGHFFEDFESEDSFNCKKFFGGPSIYVHGRMVPFLCEHPGNKVWRGKKFKIEVWNGCLIPSHRNHHKSLLIKINDTSVHPVITKWLCLPQSSKYFETVERKRNSLKKIGHLKKASEMLTEKGWFR